MATKKLAISAEIPRADELGSVRNVTFNVKRRKKNPKHRRTKSDPHQPLSHTKLLQEEINQLQKKKFALESGKEPLGWSRDRKDRRKLQEAIDLVLAEKRHEQLVALKKR